MSELDQQILPDLSNEIRDRVEQCANACFLLIATSFREYAKKVHAKEWANYEEGETSGFVACYASTIHKIVTGLPEGVALLPDVPRFLARYISNVLKDVSSTGLIPATSPWRVSELFGNEKFLRAMRLAIRREIRNTEMPVHQVCDSRISGSAQADQQHSAIRTKRGRPRRFTRAQLEKAREMKRAGKRNNEIAKLLYGTNTPNPNQRRSVSTILRHHFGSKK